ncbi:MAG: hypothetical protein RSC20_03030 [Clostridiales bacterium]
MKKLIFPIMLLAMVMCLFGCTKENDQGGTSFNWGPEINLSFDQREDGTDWVVDENAKDILNVTDYVQANIFFDELSGVCRGIQTYTSIGTRKEVDEGGNYVDTPIYRFDYYDTSGKLIEKKTDFNLHSLIGNVAVGIVDGKNSALKNMATSKIIESNSRENFVTETGFISESGKFFDKDGKLLNKLSISKTYMTIIPVIKNRYLDFNLPWEWSNKTISMNGAFLETAQSDNPESADYNMLMDNTESADYNKKIDGIDSPLYPSSLYRCKIGTDENIKLVDSEGNILDEPKEKDVNYSLLGDDRIVVYKADKTEICDRKTLKVQKTIPFKTTYCDEKHYIVSLGEWRHYLSDYHGKQLTPYYDKFTQLRNTVDDNIYLVASGSETPDNAPYFAANGGEVVGANESAILNADGEILFIDKFGGGFTYVGNGEFAVHSRAGQYLLNSRGEIVEMYSIGESYRYNEANNSIEVVPVQ